MLTATLLATPASAEQMQRLGRYEVHYVVVNTTFLQPDVAARLGITRAPTTALVNISVLDDDGKTPVAATISGTARNLLGTTRQLEFRQVREGPAIYSIATLRFSEQEHWRFAIELALPDGHSERLSFQQQLFLPSPAAVTTPAPAAGRPGSTDAAASGGPHA